MNKVVLLGNLCKDIETRYTQNNKMVIQNTLGVRNDYKNSNGEYSSQFINFKVWNNQAQYLSKYAKKGSRILLEGRLETRTYENDKKEKKYITEVICEKLQILDSKKKDKDEETTEEIEVPESEVDPFQQELELKDSDLPW